MEMEKADCLNRSNYLLKKTLLCGKQRKKENVGKKTMQNIIEQSVLSYHQIGVSGNLSLRSFRGFFYVFLVSYIGCVPFWEQL